MDTEVGTWANLFFGPTNVGEWRTHIALGLGDYGQAVQVAKAVHLLPKRSQAFFWSEVGRALVAEKQTRDKGIRVLLHAEQLAPQMIRYDVFVHETVAGLLRQARRDAGGGRELRGLAWRMGVARSGELGRCAPGVHTGPGTVVGMIVRASIEAGGMVWTRWGRWRRGCVRCAAGVS
jgi:hypothetical protein